MYMSATFAYSSGGNRLGASQPSVAVRSVVASMLAETRAFLSTALLASSISPSVSASIAEDRAPSLAATGDSALRTNDRAEVRSSEDNRASVAPAGGSEPSLAPRSMDTSLTPEQQLEELVRHHLDAVYRVAYSVVRDNALAEDVAQDAILKAWKALPTFRGDSSLRSWLLRITHNTAISTLRKRREEIRDPDLLPERETSMTTEHQVVDRMSIDAFEEALNQLDELSRSIVVLREVEGLSYDEIANMLDVALPTVKTRLLRARRVLAAALDEWRP